jgi:hypothetical protein
MLPDGWVDVRTSFEIHWLLFTDRLKIQMATEVSRFAAGRGAMALAEPSQTVQEKHNPGKLSVRPVHRRSSAKLH